MKVDIKDKEKRAFILRMKKLYGLSDERTEAEMSEDIAKGMEALF